MKIERRWHSFSLVELVIVLAVIVIMIGLGLFALGSAQRTSRDQERQNQVAKILTAVNDYFRATNSFPNTGNVTWTATSVTVGTTAITLRGYLQYSASQTTASQTRYYYSKDATGYSICVKLENGSWYRLGAGGVACPTN